MADTATVDGLIAELQPPESQGDVDAWLAKLEAKVAAILAGFVRRELPGALRAYAATLTAAGDPAALFEVQSKFGTLIENDVGELLGGIHLSGSLSAWVQAPSSPLVPLDFTDNWLQVTNLEAFEYQRQATNRIVGASDALWADVRSRTAVAIHQGIDNEDLTKQVQAITGYTEFRANTIARTETVAAYNGGNYVGAQALGEFGPAEKWWLSAEDARVRPTHAAADGQVVAFASNFVVGGVPMSRPHDPGAPARETVNCRCIANFLYPGDTRPDGSIVQGAAPTPREDLDSLDGDGRDWYDKQTPARLDLSGVESLNATLRAGRLPADLDLLDRLDTAVANGVRVPGRLPLYRSARIDGLDVGDEIVEPGFLRVSLDERDRAGFGPAGDSDNVLLRVVDRDDDVRFLVTGEDYDLLGPRDQVLEVLDVKRCAARALLADIGGLDPVDVMAGCPTGGSGANVSMAGRVKFSDDDVRNWIAARLAQSTGKPPSAQALLKEWKALGRAANDVRWRRLYGEAAGTAPKAAQVVEAVTPRGPAWKAPIQPNASKTLTARASEKPLRRHLKGENLGSYNVSGNAKADVARKLTARLESRGEVLRPGVWHRVKEQGGDPMRTVFYQDGRHLQVNDSLTQLYQSLQPHELPLFRRGLSNVDVRKYDWPEAWRQRYGYNLIDHTLGADLDTAKLTNARASELVHQWAITSNDSNATSLNLQRAAIEEFDLDPDTLADWQISEHLQAEMDRDWATHRDEYRVFLRAMYDETQDMFRELGVTEVRAVRGFSFGRSPNTPDWAYHNGDYDGLKLRPMSSFAWSQRQADKFASGVHTYSTIPVERIIGTPRSGFGCLDETELVVLGGDNTMTVSSTLRPPYTPPPSPTFP